MRILFLSALGAALLFPQTQAPASPPDSRTLQSILEEVQKLRQDFRTSAASIQHAQLLLYRMRLQMDAVSRATERLEEARRELTQFKFQRDQGNSRLKYMEDQLNRSQDSAARTQLEEEISQVKQWQEQWSSRESEAQAKEAECASQVRLEEAKLDDLQRQFDSLDRRLELAAQTAPIR